MVRPAAHNSVIIGSIPIVGTNLLSQPIRATLTHMNAHAKISPFAPPAAPSDEKLKEEFAELLLRRPTEVFEVAKIVSDNDFALSFVRSRAWPSDPYVKLHQKRLLEQFGEEYFLPTMPQMFNHLWARVTGTDGRQMEDRDYNAGFRLAAEMRHFVGNVGPTGGKSDPIHHVTRIELVAPSFDSQPMKTIEHDAS